MMLNFGSLYGRFFQIGYVTRDIDAAVSELVRRTGAKVIDIIRDMRDGSGAPTPLMNLSHLSLPGVELEVIQPRLDGPALYLDFLPERNDELRFHHFGFVVPDRAAWDAVVAQLAKMKTPIVFQYESAELIGAYIDTRRQTGHYSEILLRHHPETARPLPI